MTEPVRRTVRGRRVETARKLMDAVVAELADASYDDITTRTISKRAGVAPATFYTYFSSKDHLIASVLGDRMSAAASAVELTGEDRAERLEQALTAMMTGVFGDRHLTRAWTATMLSLDPDIVTIRDGVAQNLVELVDGALGSKTGPLAQITVLLAISGALVAAGQDIVPFADLPAAIRQATALILAGDDALAADT